MVETGTQYWTCQWHEDGQQRLKGICAQVRIYTLLKPVELHLGISSSSVHSALKICCMNLQLFGVWIDAMITTAMHVM